MKSFLKKKILHIIITFLIILILILIFFLFKENIFNKNNDKQKEIKSLVKKVEEHMFLPEGENPTIATVADKEALKGQNFFENAKEGDKVLIYTKARKAILYDPEADKIITIAPLYLEDSSSPLGNTDATVLEDQF